MRKDKILLKDENQDCTKSIIFKKALFTVLVQKNIRLTLDTNFPEINKSTANLSTNNNALKPW